MQYLRAWRPTPSFVVSCISLFVALSGTAVALQGQNSVKSDDIAKGAVHTGDVADHTLKNVDFAPGTLLQGPQGPPGPAGGGGGGGGSPSGPAGGALAGSYPNPTLATNAIPADGTGIDGTTKIAPNAIGFSEMNDNSVHSAQIFNGAVTGRTIGDVSTVTKTENVPNSINSTVATANCPSGSQLISGGFSFNGAAIAVSSGPGAQPADSWVVVGRPTGGTGTVTAIAVCLS